MVLSDFLSKQNHDESNPHEVIPISFNIHNLLQENIIILECQKSIWYRHNPKLNLVE